MRDRNLLRAENTDNHVNQKYLSEGTLRAVTLKGKWFDIGTFDVSSKLRNI